MMPLPFNQTQMEINSAEEIYNQPLWIRCGWTKEMTSI